MRKTPNNKTTQQVLDFTKKGMQLIGENKCYLLNELCCQLIGEENAFKLFNEGRKERENENNN